MLHPKIVEILFFVIPTYPSTKHFKIFRHNKALKALPYQKLPNLKLIP